MYQRAIRGPGRRGLGRILPRLTVPVCVAALATLATLTTNSPSTQPTVQAARLTAGTVTAAPAVASSSASSVAVGVQDSWISADCWTGKPGSPAVDSGKNWTGLHVGTVRFSPTWDIALPASELKGKMDPGAVGKERTCFSDWLNQIAGKQVDGRQVTAEIAFKPDYCYANTNRKACPDTQKGQVIIPTLSEYQAAMKAFAATYLQNPVYAKIIKFIAPWGEPDYRPAKPKPTKSDKHPKREPPLRIGSGHGVNFANTNCKKNAGVDDCGPKLAAAMWITVRELWPTGTVIAGDFGGDGSKDYNYLKPYNAYLKAHDSATGLPAVWGIHPYGDVKYAECQRAKRAHCTRPAPHGCKAGTLVACFSGWLKQDGYRQSTQIYLDEVSSFYEPGNGWGRKVQAAGATYLLSKLPKVTAPGDPVVTRIYYMRFAGKTADALIYKDHREPVYNAIANRHHHAAKHPKKTSVRQLVPA